MKSTLAAVLLVLLGVSFFPHQANAQFVNGAFYIGPELGIGAYYGSGLPIGAYGEAAITNPGKVGSGRLAIAGRVDYWGWNDGFYSWSFIPISAYCNYHFLLDDRTWDLFAGLGLGYIIINSSYSGTGAGLFAWNSSVYVTGNAGARYFFTPNIAARALLGFGAAWLTIGVDFKL